jgi:uncharacterized protein (TIGR02391 family)
MYQSVSSIIPNAGDLLALEVEELAGVLIVHLNSFDRGTDASIFRDGLINQRTFLEPPHLQTRGQAPEYGTQQPVVNLALLEAWAWLEGQGLLIKEPFQRAGCFFFISRRGKTLKSQSEFDGYRRASLLPKAQLHPLIAARVYPPFLRGDYDTAIFQAFWEIEVAVREAGGFGPDDYGTPLMNKSFKPSEKSAEPVSPGPLTDAQLVVAEQEGMRNLFAGAIAFYKNPQSHRHVPSHAEDAAEP